MSQYVKTEPFLYGSYFSILNTDVYCIIIGEILCEETLIFVKVTIQQNIKYM